MVVLGRTQGRIDRIQTVLDKRRMGDPASTLWTEEPGPEGSSQSCGISLLGWDITRQHHFFTRPTSRSPDRGGVKSTATECVTSNVQSATSFLSARVVGECVTQEDVRT